MNKIYQKSFLGGKNAGFTLIELLVVVLIIGILAAIALPKYELAVEKSRASEALANIKSLAAAQRLYFMSNGVYTDNINDLDIFLQGEDSSLANRPRKNSKWFSYGVKDGTIKEGAAALNEIAVANRLPVDSAYMFAVRDKRLICMGYSKIGRKVCASLAISKISGSSESTIETWLINSNF